jgi:hypothetical protein
MAKLLLRYGADCAIQGKGSQYAFDLITNHEERLALQQQQCWRDRRGMVLLQREVSESSASRHEGASAHAKVLHTVDVFRHIVQFI